MALLSFLAQPVHFIVPFDCLCVIRCFKMFSSLESYVLYCGYAFYHINSVRVRNVIKLLFLSSRGLPSLAPYKPFRLEILHRC